MQIYEKEKTSIGFARKSFIYTGGVGPLRIHNGKRDVTLLSYISFAVVGIIEKIRGEGSQIGLRSSPSAGAATRITARITPSVG